MESLVSCILSIVAAVCWQLGVVVADKDKAHQNRSLPPASQVPRRTKMKGSMKRVLKRSSFIIGAVRSIRGGIDDIKKLYGFTIRGGQVNGIYAIARSRNYS